MYIKKRIPDGYVFLRLFACKNALRFIHASKLEINIRQVFSFHLHIDKYFVFKFDIIVFLAGVVFHCYLWVWKGLIIRNRPKNYQNLQFFGAKSSILASYDPIYEKTLVFLGFFSGYDVDMTQSNITFVMSAISIIPHN